eukprot:GHVT01028179.1.p1 GENE.GHVT01028179.1~~GHVT01028179.1.p1  ORF type:complete len:216 (-),score=34.11 GHVT01028179.1:166-813(-)
MAYTAVLSTNPPNRETLPFEFHSAFNAITRSVLKFAERIGIPTQVLQLLQHDYFPSGKLLIQLYNKAAEKLQDLRQSTGPNYMEAQTVYFMLRHAILAKALLHAQNAQVDGSLVDQPALLALSHFQLLSYRASGRAVCSLVTPALPQLIVGAPVGSEAGIQVEIMTSTLAVHSTLNDDVPDNLQTTSGRNMAKSWVAFQTTKQILNGRQQPQPQK